MSGRPDTLRAAAAAAELLLRQRLCRLPVEPAALELDVPFTVDTMQNFCAHSRKTMPELREYSDTRDGCCIRLRRNGINHYLILFNGDVASPARRRFTLAHEIGHIVLGHEADGPREETEADCFAASLLVPAALAWELWRQSRDISVLCGVFGVSKIVARRRIGGFPACESPSFPAGERALLERYAPLLPRHDHPVVDF